jgi:nitrite reductase/ring-hydroxylating ferredoxin subunit/uncharacterized membrane protein
MYPGAVGKRQPGKNTVLIHEAVDPGRAVTIGDRIRTHPLTAGGPLVLTPITDAIEGSSTADRVGSLLERVAAPLRRVPNGRSALSGTAIGHPLHPLLVTAPLGMWLSGSALDLTGRHPSTARLLVGVGVLAALPTAATGASDWLDTEGAERRVGSTHATLNVLATAAYGASWWLRPKRPRIGVALGFAGMGLVSAAGWLGGHLTYGLGVGVDANAFEAGPTSWTDLGLVPQAGIAMPAEVEGTRLAATHVNGRPAVLADRCSHRGGPLSEGSVVDGCFTCPWHGSHFDARNGQVRRGPASVPQPAYETRTEAGAVQVRRLERRALRSNAV